MPEWTLSTALHDADGKLPEYIDHSIQLKPDSHSTKLRLQYRSEAVLDKAAFERVFGSIMSTTSHGETGDSFSVFWLSPNEWLIASSGMDVAHWREKLMQIAPDQTHVVTDLSHSLITIKVSGENSQTLLAEGCGIDLHREVFSVGRYVSTRLYGLSTIIHRISEGSVFRIYVDRCAALHLWHWLEDGARQFGSHSG